MNHPGYQWTIIRQCDDWHWALLEHDRSSVLVEGLAPSRAIAAAFVVRAIGRGMTATLMPERIAA